MTVKIALKGINSEFKKIEKEQNKEIQTKLLITANTMKADLVSKTPIDTGEARAGWSVIPGLFGPSIVNNVNHIEHLNNGHSKQAASLFIERTALKYGRPIGTIVKVKKN
jgi:hypothetical protein